MLSSPNASGHAILMAMPARLPSTSRAYHGATPGAGEDHSGPSRADEAHLAACCQNDRVLGEVAFVLAMVAVIIAARLVADRLKVPDSIVLTVCGLIYAGLPGPILHLEPHLVLLLVITPLLYGAARRSSLLAIRANWRPIASLSVVLVLLTAFAVGALVSLIVPRLTLAAGLVLGAAVAPTDPVAALSVGSRAGLPPRLVTLIGGEGLLNDATALTTWQVAVAATVGGGFSLGYAAGKFVLAAAGGLVIGAAIGYVLRLGRHLLRDPLVANTVSLATPFLAYLAGEEAHVSGVLAVVIAGLMAGHDPPSGESGAARLQTGAVWRLVEYLLEGLVFLLIGQQLPAVLAGLSDEPAGTTAAAILATLGAVLMVRPLWLFLTQVLPGRLGWRLGDRAPPLNGREAIALSWAGTRGAITLATAFAIPAVSSGRPFPDRDLILLCAYVVVLVTLLGQGLTFGPVLRRLGLRANAAEEIQVRNEARLAALAAGSAAVDDMETEAGLPESVAAALRDALGQRTDRLRARISLLDESDGDISSSPELETAVQAQHAVIAAQRAELIRWRDCGRLPDESLRKLQHELDLQERTLPGRP
jgi:monovalent cation/hydrogen antiporter